MAYRGDVGDTCPECRQRIGLDGDGTYACGCVDDEGESEAEAWANFDAIPCAVCKSGVAYPLGQLGNRQHFRCRQCGAESSQVAT